MGTWTIFYVFFLFGFSQCQYTQLMLDVLTGKLVTAFNNLGNVLRPTDLVANFSTISITPVDSNAAQSILMSSKLATESLINKTNSAVDNMQATLTNVYSQYVMPPASAYSLDCNNYLFVNFYQANSIQNASVANYTRCGIQSLPFTPDPLLDNVLTNRNYGTTHVPANVCNASINVQNAANWTLNTDKLFALNQYDSQLKWQFFCSTTGLFKIFPGIQWQMQIADSLNNASLVDFFDCRAEQFYLQSTSYAKKVIIMLDQSGSMAGRSRILANQTVYEILNTLTENDYFNIFLFNTICSRADNQTRTLIQATDKNKYFLLKQLTTSFMPNYTANFNRCLNITLRELQRSLGNQTSNVPYNNFIMLITDGNIDVAVNYSTNTFNPRLFTYQIGQGSPTRIAVSQLACANKGFADEIATLSDVKENVQDHLNVLARPNAIMQNAFNVWTGIHQTGIKVSNASNTNGLQPSSITTSSPIANTSSSLSSRVVSTTASSTITLATQIKLNQNTPIKLFVTSSKAIYDQSLSTVLTGTGTLLGAVGIYVSPNDFIKTAPFWKIGVNAYLFGITNNGFVLFHPRYRPQYKNYMKYFYRNVDISEVEINSNYTITGIRSDQIVVTNDLVQLRNELINQLSNSSVKASVLLTTYQITDDFKTGFNTSRNYYVAAINKTSYIFGLGVPVNQKVPLFSNQTFSVINITIFQQSFKANFITLNSTCSTIFVNQNQQGITMINFEFCNMSPAIAALQIQSPLCALINVMVNNTLLGQCTINRLDALLYLNNIYIEVISSNTFVTFWAGINGLMYNVQQVFSMLHFGLIVYYNYDNLTYQNFITNHSLGIGDPIYQETILTCQFFGNNATYVAISLPNEVFKTNVVPNSYVFTVTTPLMINGTYVGVVGVQAKHAYFQSILTNSLLCYDMATAECFVITESATILFNNQNNNLNGMLLKDVDCGLMESLVNSSIFLVQYFYDMQALCNVSVTASATSFSTRLINPFSYLFKQIMWLVYEFFIIIRSFSLTNLLWLPSFQEENPDYKLPSVYAGRPCYLKIPSVMVNPFSNQINGTIACANCNLSWFIRPISNTNLFLVVLLKSISGCSCNCSSNFGQTVELTRNVSISITNATTANPSYFSNFVTFTKTENATICTNMAHVSRISQKSLSFTVIPFILICLLSGV